MANKDKIRERAVRGLSLRLIATFLFVLVFIFCAASCSRSVTLSKEEISDRLTDMADVDKGYAYVGSYLKEYGIGNFNIFKFQQVENNVNTYFYRELPAPHIMATDVVELFLDKCYDYIDIEDETVTTDALLDCYMYCTGDRYAFYRDAEEYADYIDSLSGKDDNMVGIGVNIYQNLETNEILISSVIRRSGAEEAGLLAGDYIIGAGSKTVAADGAEAVLGAISGEAGTRVDITVRRGEEELTLSVERRLINTAETVYYELDEQTKIAYIEILSFKENTAEHFISAIDSVTSGGAVGIIFDLRSNPGGLLTSVVDVIDYIAPEGARIASYVQSGNERIYYSDDGHSIELPMVVLCNGETASAGELFCAAIRDYASEEMGLINATLVGETTFGKGIAQADIRLNDGSALTFTIAYYNPPCDINYHDEGIVPDITETDDPLGTAEEELLSLIAELSESIPTQM